ncbi:MAG: LemA family protein [Bacteroidetes bacterium]|nr:LemA family protein [Bacteroidota bacterium]
MNNRHTDKKTGGTGCLGAVIVGVPLALAFLVIFVWAWIGFNRMVSKEESVHAQWAQVENTYQRRADLIENLVETVKGYMSHEYKTLTEVTEARAKATSLQITTDNLSEEAIQQFETMHNGLNTAFGRLLGLIERYPDLKADRGFLRMQNQLESIENTILIERSAYNEVARNYNTYIRKFPINVFASVFRFDGKGYFTAKEGSDVVPEVDFSE